MQTDAPRRRRTGFPSAIAIALLLHLVLLYFPVNWQNERGNSRSMQLLLRQETSVHSEMEEKIGETERPDKPEPKPEDKPRQSTQSPSSSGVQEPAPRLRENWREAFREQLAATSSANDYQPLSPPGRQSFEKSEYAARNTDLLDAVDGLGDRSYTCGRITTIDLGFRTFEMPVSRACSKKAFDAQFRDIPENELP